MKKLLIIGILLASTSCAKFSHKCDSCDGESCKISKHKKHKHEHKKITIEDRSDK